jgi:hypothetical protein
LSDPVRIREAGSDVPVELRELFRSAAKPEPPSAAVGAMLSSRVAGMTAATASAPALVKLLPWLLGGAVALGGVAAYRAGRVEPSPPAPKAPSSVLATPMPEPLPAPPPAPSPAAPSPARSIAPRASAPSVAAGEDSLVGEEKLLNEAHAVLAASPRRALALAKSHAKRYPHGQLVAERDLIMIEALVGLGRRREAEELGRQLRATAPNNIYEERLDEILRER